MKTLAISLLVLAGTFATLSYDAGAYTQPASVVDSGGGVSTSAGYENLAAIGQPIVGLSSGTGGSNHAGFIPVLGGTGGLYPIISFDPATFTFTFLCDGTPPAGQGLTITNSGGSTLEWLVARTQAWLSLVPLNGSGGGTVSVSILTTGLTPGVYTDTITITAPGAENSGVTIPVTLTVTSYTLTLTFGSPTAPAGGGYVTIANHKTDPPVIVTCTGTPNPCLNSYCAGAPLELTAYPNNDSLFNSWSGCDTSGPCSVTMSSARSVTATFSYVPPAMIEGVTQPFFSLVDAYNYAKLHLLTSVIIKSRVYTFVENLTLTDPINVTLKGGYAPNYVDRPGYTLLQGKLTVGKGSLVTDRLTVK
jgi:hypothetical protein